MWFVEVVLEHDLDDLGERVVLKEGLIGDVGEAVRLPNLADPV